MAPGGVTPHQRGRLALELDQIELCRQQVTTFLYALGSLPISQAHEAAPALATLPATTLSTETYSSGTVVTTLERACNFDTCIILRLPVEETKTSVSDTASALQVLVSFQYLNKTCCASTWFVKEHKNKVE